MQKYVLVKFLEPVHEGDEFIADNYWPLHITLVANFTVPYDAQELADVIGDKLRDQKALELVAGADEYFGANRDIQVTAMVMTPDMLELHKKLVGILETEGAAFDEPKYMKDGYRAHATVQKKARLHTGDSVAIDEITIVDMFPDSDIHKRRVLQTIRFL